MRFFSIYRLMALFRKPWMKWPLIILALICFGLAVWIGGPMTGVALFATIWFRATVIGVVLGIFLIIQLVKLRRRRRAARELEDAIVPAQPVGDGKVLAERMGEALKTLKKSGGRTYLYDLPWYVIIGPPGAGKTTALRNSGIEFPLAGQDGGVVEGFGGTRNCDWWFSEEAILIDTAGRYTTQDSDAQADETSWKAFLNLLKKGRPKQPINGVMLAFSVDEMMRASPEVLATHAATVRARLGEIHDTLKIDFPVYVLFTKADLISGFREYFGSFSQSRRKNVWGVTFPTKDRTEQTWQSVPGEFDALVSRLSDEVTDRMSEEPDSISRIAIFGLPGQMALLRDNVGEFLRRVFEPTRYKTNAILRGFYFTSGTQEGTPIDQVLGEMSRNPGGAVAAFQPSFMSGSGKSYFLHDLLRRVIFEERDWVSHDERAVRRSMILRTAGISLIALLTVGLLSAFGYSYWQNASLVRTANAEAGRYAREHAQEIAREVIDDPSLQPVLKPLQDLRIMSAGYGSSQKADMWEKFGLGQRNRLEAASDAAYSDALERMLRPRLILFLERELPRLQNQGATTDIYRALKVYMLLGGAGERSDDAAIKSYFAERWRAEYDTFDLLDARDQLNDHLAAMLELDDTRDPLVGVTVDTVAAAQEAIVQLPLAEQAYSTIVDNVGSSGIPDFQLLDRLGPNASLVFQTTDGSDLADLGVPALFTYEGYWGFFLGELDTARERLEADQWVLGEAAERVDFDRQIQGLRRALHTTYRREFRDAWEAMFDKIGLASMSADKPAYNALAAASSPVASPLLGLVREVDRETRLTLEFDYLDAITPDMLSGGSVGDEVGAAALQRVRSRAGGAQRILMDAVMNRDKSQESVGGGSASLRTPVEQIERQFEGWHVLLKGTEGQRPIDVLLSNLQNIRSNLRLSGTAPGQADMVLQQLLSALTNNNSQLPETMARLVNEAEQDFRSEAQDANLAEMNRALNDDIFLFCRENIAPFYPLTQSNRHISPRIFGEFFGPGGKMDTYFTTYLEPHVTRTVDGIVPREGTAIAARLSPNTLRQFDRAEKLRAAFFASGSLEPQVTMFVSHVDSHSSIREAVLAVNGTVVTSRAGDPPQPLAWPGQGTAVTLQFLPRQNRDSNRTFSDGRWAIVDFFRSAQSIAQDQNIVRVTHQIGGRTITYRVEAESTTMPFTMRELGAFECPASLD